MQSKNGVLLTRAGADNDELAANLRAESVFVMILPCIQIAPVLAPSQWHKALQLAKPSNIVVTSRWAATMLRNNWPDHFNQAAVYSVGKQTAAAMKSYFDIKSTTPASTGSEGLLLLPQLNKVSNTHWLIIGGENPRPLLADTLTERGAIVTHLACYRRLCPSYSAETVARLEIESVSTAVIYSLSALENLAATLKKHNKNNLLETSLLLPSERYEPIARALGFCGKMLIMDEHSEAADIVHQLHTMLDRE